MNRLLKTGLFLFLVIGLFSDLYANHFLGGEITWKRVSNSSSGNPRYVFYMRIYRDCSGEGAVFNDLEDIRVKYNSNLSKIVMKRIGFRDITPNCGREDEPSFVGERIQPCNIDDESIPSKAGSLTENLYQSEDTVELIGTPPVSTGWIFYFDDSRDRPNDVPFRNFVDNIQNNNSNTFAVRSVMYVNDLNNFDNSPEFLERPLSIFPTKVEFQYNPNGYDTEQDSLVYEFAQLFDDKLKPISKYQANYSYIQPFPGRDINPNNIPVFLNSVTGEMKMLSNNIGAYAFCIKVTAYDKCTRIKKAEVVRDMQVRFLDQNRLENRAPVVSIRKGPKKDTVTSINYKVVAGEKIELKLAVANYEYLYTFDGKVVGYQDLKFTATGGQFGAGFIDANGGCLIPPCAFFNNYNSDYVRQQEIYPVFTWQTTCDHVRGISQCGDQTNVYSFILTAEDNACPAGAKNVVTITVTVEPKPYIPSPQLKCLSLNSNNALRLSWDIVKDTLDSFDAYVVYHSENLNGPYIQIAEITDINTLSYIHQGLDLTNTKHYYYVSTRSGCFNDFISPPLDTLQGVELNLTNLGEGKVDVDWKSMNVSGDDLDVGSYELYRKKNKLENWEKIADIDAREFQDNVFTCDTSYIYYKAVWVEQGCSSYFIDDSVVVMPDIPEVANIKVVSVDTSNGQIILKWHESKDIDAASYMIYSYQDGKNILIDSVLGKQNTIYVDKNADANSQTYSYDIAVKDSCGNIGLLSEKVHNSIYLSLNQDVCQRSNILSWNKYQNMNPDVSYYKIHISIDGGLYVLLDSVDKKQNSYTHKEIDLNKNYCYFVEASNGLDDAFSNKVCSQSQFQQKPICYLRKANVLSDNSIELMWHAEMLSNVKQFELNRTIAGKEDWQLIATLPANENISYEYIDTEGLTTNTHSYVYRLNLINDCNQNVLISNLGQTILLNANANNDGTNSLAWNYYLEWVDGVKNYIVYRENIFGVFEEINQLSWEVLTYVDNVIDLSDLTGLFCYKIQAVEENTANQIFKDTVWSNKVCVNQISDMDIPNAFAPTIHNNAEFKPKPYFVNQEGYSMMIFNRWGEKIFETFDLQKGWDGKYNGQYLASDVYVYLIKYKNNKGETVIRKNWFTLVR